MDSNRVYKLLFQWMKLTVETMASDLHFLAERRANTAVGITAANSEAIWCFFLYIFCSS